jgi:hypothetical protein
MVGVAGGLGVGVGLGVGLGVAVGLRLCVAVGLGATVETVVVQPPRATAITRPIMAPDTWGLPTAPRCLRPLPLAPGGRILDITLNISCFL